MGSLLPLLRAATQRKLISCANSNLTTPDCLLNKLIDDEWERIRLAEFFENDSRKAISQLCESFLSQIGNDLNSAIIRDVIERLFDYLISNKVLSLNCRKNAIVDSNRINIAEKRNSELYKELAKNISFWFGTYEIHLFHKEINPVNEFIFIGMPNNVFVSECIFYGLYNRLTSEENSLIEMQKIVKQLGKVDAFIENNDYGDDLHFYAFKKYRWATGD